MKLLAVIRDAGLVDDDDALRLISDRLLALATLGVGIRRRGRMWVW